MGNNSTRSSVECETGARPCARSGVEHPILFTGEMVRAVLADRKTQTRRPVTRRTSVLGSGSWDGLRLDKGWIDPGGTKLFGPGPYLKAPRRSYGEDLVHRIYPRWEPADLLWVRETWAPVDWLRDVDREEPICVGYRADRTAIAHELDNAHEVDTYGWNWDRVHWRPSIHMPKWAARMWLLVTDVRVERVQDLSEDDARAEGLPTGETHRATINGESGSVRFFDPVSEFWALWDSMYGGKQGLAWADNPWVWVVSFERVEGTHAP